MTHAVVPFGPEGGALQGGISIYTGKVHIWVGDATIERLLSRSAAIFDVVTRLTWVAGYTLAALGACYVTDYTVCRYGGDLCQHSATGIWAVYGVGALRAWF